MKEGERVRETETETETERERERERERDAAGLEDGEKGPGKEMPTASRKRWERQEGILPNSLWKDTQYG